MNEPVIVAALRSPIGMFQGRLASGSAVQLGAGVLSAVRLRLEAQGLDADEVLMGCVLPAGIGQAPARQAALHAGFSAKVPCTTINKVCGSGMKTILIACDMLRAGSAATVIAGGMESMSNAPYILKRHSDARQLGNRALLDHMFCDGLEDPDEHQLMGYYAEQCADRYALTREAQDQFAASSLTRARAAQASGAFDKEIVPLQIAGQTVTEDEGPGRFDVSRIERLKPVFRAEGGTITAANASSIADGAAALALTTRANAERVGCRPLARVVGQATHARMPAEFTTAPVGALRSLFEQLAWTDRDVELYEINEAFAVVVLVAAQELGIDHAKINVNGGACALGHPVGATGARIVVTLCNALRQRGLRRGVATLCIGGGEATAVAIELL
jgi:acetyl-CoA C-acetyltransferase